MSSPQEIFDRVPPLTRTWLGLCVLTTLGARLSLIASHSIVLIFPAVFQNFEIWRLFTNFLFFGPFSFNWLIAMYFLYTYCGALESDPYRTTRGTTYGDVGDFAFCMLFCSILSLGMGYMLDLVVLGPVLSFAMLYLWSRRNPEAPVKIWMFAFKGAQLPWVLAALNFLLGNSPTMDLSGMCDVVIIRSMCVCVVRCLLFCVVSRWRTFGQ
jgi:Derlin-2/3